MEEQTTQEGNELEKALARRIKEEAELTRLEKNLDAMPIWAPSQYASARERRYKLPWRGPSAEVKVQASGRYGQLRAFDKLTLTALVQLWHVQGQDSHGYVRFQIIDLIHLLERKDQGGKLYKQLRESLYRLRGCVIQYFESFYDQEGNEYVSNPNATVLSEFYLIEDKRLRNRAVQRAFTQWTYAVLDFDVVQNLIGNYTRPISLKFLQSLSERGVLLEAYVNSVLYRNEKVSKDVFDLWRDLGFSRQGIRYASELTQRLKKDLGKMVGNFHQLLGSYEFTKSKTKPKSLNLNLYRSRAPTVRDVPARFDMRTRKSRKTGNGVPGVSTDKPAPAKRGGRISSQKVELLVDEIKERLRDKSKDDRNLRKIARVMPYSEIEHGIHEAWARFRDGLTPNPTRYFVGVMKKKAAEQGIELGLPRAAPPPGGGQEGRGV